MTPSRTTESVTIDLTNYKEKVSGRVPPGTYTVVVDDVEVAKSKQQNAMYVLYLRILDKGEDIEGTTIIDRLTQTEGALFRTVAFMQAIGMPTPRKRLQVNLGQWRGKRLLVDLDDGEPYQGRIKSEVRGYSKIGTSPDGGVDDLEEPGEGDEGDMPEDLPEETVASERTDGESTEEVDLDRLDLG